MALVHGFGVNDMPKGYCRQGIVEQKTYETWYEAVRKCYPSSRLDTQPTFKGCTVCEEWTNLSQFVEDIKDLPGYEDWVKGLKGEGPRMHLVTRRQTYSKDNCVFTTHATKRMWIKED